jgi:tetratricopeptide (TPR) repeat protein
MLSTVQQVASLAPQNVDARLTLAAAYAVTGNMRDGTAAAREALRLDPDLYGPHYVLGYIFVREDKPQDALAEARTAVRMRPDLPETQNLLAYILNQTGEHNDALAAAQEALRLKREPVDEGWAYYNVATASDKLGQRSAALDAYRRALAAYNNAGRTLDPDELYFMGIAYLNLDQDAQAIAAFQQAVKVRPTFAQARYNLGVAFFAAGNRTAAMAQYNELRRLDPARAAKLLSVIRK